MKLVGGDVLGLCLFTLAKALFILAMLVQTDVYGKLAYFLRLEVGALVLKPSEAVGVARVKKIPEIGLRITPEQVINLIASAGGEVKEGARERNIHTVL